MRFAIITHVPHTLSNGRLSAYGPYVREMNVWAKHAGTVEVVAPLRSGMAGAIDIEYDHPDIIFTEIRSFNLLTVASKLRTILKLPAIAISIAQAMRRADHIHLRCPGNIGLVGCALQVFFPSKPKTAKYAGNWDPKSRQPLSYRIQKWILNNTLLTRNMQVLVYGQWKGSSANIRPFFTATYKESEKTPLAPREFSGPLKLLFVGTLSPGKRPLYAVQIAERLLSKGCDVTLDLYGEGRERQQLESYIRDKNLEPRVRLLGNQHEITVRQAYKSAHFVLLPSRSEGWPKVVAEAMFWGCLPGATPVSCVAYMLDEGERGVILHQDVETDSAALCDIFADPARFEAMSQRAARWSRQFTLDEFSKQVEKVIHGKA